MRVADREFLCVDVGGQKSERNRWEQVFRNVAAIVYMVSLSEVRDQKSPQYYVVIF